MLAFNPLYQGTQSDGRGRRGDTEGLHAETPPRAQRNSGRSKLQHKHPVDISMGHNGRSSERVFSLLEAIRNPLVKVRAERARGRAASCATLWNAPRILSRRREG